MSARRPIAVCLLLLAMLVPAANSAADELDDYLFAPFGRSTAMSSSTADEIPGSAWLADPELRISPERDRFDRTSQVYSFRFRPAGRKERHANDEMLRLENRIAHAEWERARTNFLATRYQRVIALAHAEVQAELAARRLDLERTVVGAEQILSATSNFDTGRLQTAVLRVELREREVTQARHRVMEMRKVTIADYLAVNEGSLPMLSARLIHPQMISSWLDRIALDPGSEAFPTRVRQLEISQAEQRLALDRSRNAFGLSLLELSYEDKQTDSYNLTFGFRLPFGQDKNRLYRSVRELGDARRRLELEQVSLTDAVHFAVQELRWLISDYAASVAALDSIRRESWADTADARVIAELREHELDLLSAAAEIHVRILRGFIDLLDTTGRLQSPARKNWLRKTIS